MTSKQDRKAVSFRATVQDEQIIDQQWKLSGLPTKQNYLLQVALKGLSGDISDTSLAGVVASQQQVIASQQKTIKQLTEMLANEGVLAGLNATEKRFVAHKASTYHVGVCVKGIEAEKIWEVAKVEQGSKYDRKAKSKLALAHSLLWVYSSTANGSQRTMEAIAEVPELC